MNNGAEAADSQTTATATSQPTPDERDSSRTSIPSPSPTAGNWTATNTESRPTKMDASSMTRSSMTHPCTPQCQTPYERTTRRVTYPAVPSAMPAGQAFRREIARTGISAGNTIPRGMRLSTLATTSPATPRHTARSDCSCQQRPTPLEDPLRQPSSMIDGSSPGPAYSSGVARRAAVHGLSLPVRGAALGSPASPRLGGGVTCVVRGRRVGGYRGGSRTVRMWLRRAGSVNGFSTRVTPGSRVPWEARTGWA